MNPLGFSPFGNSQNVGTPFSATPSIFNLGSGFAPQKSTIPQSIAPQPAAAPLQSKIPQSITQSPSVFNPTPFPQQNPLKFSAMAPTVGTPNTSQTFAMPGVQDFKDVWSGIGQGMFGDASSYDIPFAGDAIELKDVLDVSAAQTRYESFVFNGGTPGTGDDYAKLLSYQSRLNELTNKRDNVGYQVGEMARGTATFMTELAVATPAAFGTGGGSLAAVFAAKGARKAAVEVLKASIAKSLTKGFAKNVAKHVAIMYPLNVANMTAQRMLDTMVISEDEKGKYLQVINGSGQSLGPAIVNSVTDRFTEVASERTGVLFSGLESAAKNQILKAGFTKIFREMNPNISMSTFQKMVEKAGWNGMFNEMLEERVGEAMHGMFYEAGLGDIPYKAPTLAQLTTELVSFAGMGSMISSVNKGINQYATPQETPESIVEGMGGIAENMRQIPMDDSVKYQPYEYQDNGLVKLQKTDSDTGISGFNFTFFPDAESAKTFSTDEKYGNYDGYVQEDTGETMLREDVMARASHASDFISNAEVGKQISAIPFLREVPIQNVQRILTGDGKYALGKYRDNIISFVNNPHETTLPHEAGHAFIDMAITEKQKKDLLSDVKRKYSALGKKLSNVEAEEMLVQDFAEAFARGDIKPKSRLEEFFKWLADMIREYAGSAYDTDRFFSDMASRTTARKVARFKQERKASARAIAEIKELYQRADGTTLKFLNSPEISSREKPASFEHFDNVRKSLQLKKGEDVIVRTVLESPQFKDSQSIDPKELARAIEHEMLSLELESTTGYDDYGMRNIGMTSSDIDTRAYILKTDFNHGASRGLHYSTEGQMSHYRSAVVDGVAHITEVQSDVFQKPTPAVYRSEEDLQQFYDFAKGKVDKYIEEQKAKTGTWNAAPGDVGYDAPQNIKWLAQSVSEMDDTKRVYGSYSAKHIRTQSRGDELRGAIAAARKEVSSKMDAKVEWNTISLIHDGVKLMQQAGISFSEKEMELVDIISHYNRTVDGNFWKKYGVTKKSLKSFVDKMEAAETPVRQYFNDIFQEDVKKSQRFNDMYTSWYETTIKMAVRQFAADGDVEKVRMATPYTAAAHEGYLDDEKRPGEMGADVEGIDAAAPGDEVEVYGEKHIFLTAGGDNEIEIARKDGDNIRVWSNADIAQLAEEEADYKLDSYKDEYLMGELANIFISNFDKLAEKKRVTGVSKKDLFNKYIAQNEDDKVASDSDVDDDAVVEWFKEGGEVDGDYDEVFEAAKDQWREELVDSFDAEEHMQDAYGRDAVWYSDRAFSHRGGDYATANRLLVVNTDGGPLETYTTKMGMRQESVDEDAHKVENWDEGDIDSGFREIAQRYGEMRRKDGTVQTGPILKFIRKWRGKDNVRTVVDDNGFSWYEFDITEKDKEDVEMYQKVNDLFENGKIKSGVKDYDKQLAITFIDYARLNEAEDVALEVEARAFAEAHGIDANVSNTVLANRFEAWLAKPVQDNSVVAARATDLTKKNGGVTITLDGDIPTEGYAFAPDKTTETKVSKEKFSDADVDAFIDKHFDLLSQPNNHLGIWEDDGMVYLDVSKVITDPAEAVKQAQAASQLAIFDLKTFTTIYATDYEKIASDALATRQDKEPVQGGSEVTTPQEGRADKYQEVDSIGLMDDLLNEEMQKEYAESYLNDYSELPNAKAKAIAREMDSVSGVMATIDAEVKTLEEAESNTVDAQSDSPDIVKEKNNIRTLLRERGVALKREHATLQKQLDELIVQAEREKSIYNRGMKKGYRQALDVVPEKMERSLLKARLQAMQRANSVGVKYGRTIGRETLRAALKERQSTIQELQAAAWSYAQNLPSMAERNSFLKRIADVKTKDALARVYEQIDSRLEDIDHTSKLENIKKIVKRVAKSKRTGNSIDVAYMRRIDEVLSGYDLRNPTEKTMNRLRSLEQFIKDNPENDVPSWRMKDLATLTQVHPKEMSNEQIQKLNDTIVQLFEIGKRKFEVRSRVDENARQAELARAIASTKNLDGEAKRARDSGLFDKKNKRSTFLSMLHAPRAADRIDGKSGYTGWNVKQVRKLNDAETRYTDEYDTIMVSVFEKLERLREGKPFSEEEEARLYWHMLVDQKADLQAEKLQEAMKWKSKPVRTQDEQYTIDVLRAAFKGEQDRLASVFESLENKPFAYQDNYFPLKYEKGGYIKEIVDDKIVYKFDEEGGKINDINVEDSYLVHTTKTANGFTIERLPGVKKLVRTDVFAVFAETMRDHLWYVNMQPHIKATADVVNDAMYQSHAGEVVVSWWKEYLEGVAKKGRAIKWNGTQALMLGIRRNLTNAILGYKLTTILVQPTAIMDAYAYMGGVYGPKVALPLVAKMMRNIFRPRFVKAYSLAHPHLKARQGGQVELREWSEQSFARPIGADSAVGKVMQAIQDNAFSLVRHTDMVTAQSVYETAYSISRKNGATDAEARSDAGFVMNLTQGSSEVTMRPNALNRGEGAKLLMTFQTFMLNRFGIMADLMANATSGRGLAQAVFGMSVFGMAFVMEQGLRNLYKLLIGDEPDDREAWKVVIGGFIQSLPIISNVGALQGVTNGFFSSGYSHPAVQAIERVVRSLQKIQKGDSVYGYAQLAEAVGILYGVKGTAQIGDLLKMGIDNYYESHPLQDKMRKKNLKKDKVKKEKSNSLKTRW